MTTTGPRVLKGHGTENDFVVLPDPDGTVWADDSLDAATTWFDAGRPDLLDAVTSVITDRTIEL